MNRISLSVGSVLEFDLRYTIDAAIGLGANCIVYDAHYLDRLGNEKPIKLKECYPATGNITRENCSLIWAADSDKESAFERFEQAYQVASKMQTDESAGNSAVYSLNILECNNTKYIAMIPENGVSYDRDTSDSIEDILRTSLALTNAVGRYHSSGYLHLDIKPSNFIAMTDHTGKGKNIALFDFDTITPMSDIAIPAGRRIICCIDPLNMIYWGERFEVAPLIWESVWVRNGVPLACGDLKSGKWRIERNMHPWKLTVKK